MITTDMRRHPPESLEDLIEENYTIYTIPKFVFNDEPIDFAVQMLQHYKGLANLILIFKNSIFSY